RPPRDCARTGWASCPSSRPSAPNRLCTSSHRGWTVRPCSMSRRAPTLTRATEENYFRYARTRFALDALDCYAAAPDDPDRMVPNPARKTAAARIRQAEAAAQAAETARDAALLELRSPAPGQATYLSNQVINALNTPVEAAYQELEQAGTAAAAV